MPQNAGQPCCVYSYGICRRKKEQLSKGAACGPRHILRQGGDVDSRLAAFVTAAVIIDIIASVP